MRTELAIGGLPMPLRAALCRSVPLRAARSRDELITLKCRGSKSAALSSETFEQAQHFGRGWAHEM